LLTLKIKFQQIITFKKLTVLWKIINSKSVCYLLSNWGISSKIVKICI